MADDDLDELLGDLQGAARQARRRLLRELLDDGCPEADIRQAIAQDRLALLPVDRILQAGARYSLQDLAREAAVELEDVRQSHRALGLTIGPDDEVRYGENDLEVTKNLRTLFDAGFTLEAVVELNRVVGRALVQVAAASRGMFTEAVFREGVDEHRLGVAAAEAARELVPRMTPLLTFAYESHLREHLRSDVISSADIASGRTPGAREIAVAFADLVGFTKLGEQVEAEEIGEVVGRLESITGGLVEKPVTFVKTIGDAVMLVAPTPDPLIETSLQILDELEGDERLQLRVGVACGPALERAGDWYGSPVNQASRVTTVARPGSVLVTDSVKRRSEADWRWSYARERKLKGVGEVKLHRVRRPADA
jgi:adenylate cyclase